MATPRLAPLRAIEIEEDNLSWRNCFFLLLFDKIAEATLISFGSNTHSMLIPGFGDGVHERLCWPLLSLWD
jgi:hypothetical protein